MNSWSDEEVARRWWYVCPERKNDDGSAAEPKSCELARFLENIDEYGRRLADISWLMRLACQTIALRANHEDDVDGLDSGFILQPSPPRPSPAAAAD